MAWTVANFNALGVTLMSLAIVSVLLRFWSRTKSKAKFGPDDALIIPAVICVVGMAVTMIIGTQVGGMAQHQTNEWGSHGEPIYTKTLANYEKANFLMQLLPLASLGFSKLSVLFFYRRIFYVYATFILVNTVLMLVVAGWAISFFFAILFQCRTPSTLWTTFEFARQDCVETLPLYYAVSITGFITNLAILISPLPVIYQLQMPLKNRVAIACILLLGAVDCAAGIARFTTFIYISRGIYANIWDLAYFTSSVFAWTMVESSLAVVGANLPLLRPLLRQKTYTDSYAWSLLRSFASRRSENGSRSRLRSDDGSERVDLHLTEKLEVKQDVV
ncbi:hypothetical protein CC80DRAFT_522348 [Byssothecium circinans]|uniref:Rhodopsin domain-containing protein n=1 Tax=Byssothecium circinans TaxID=147558 RepID=A0A6A5UD49_9PLEO|nr:hypothetical protein CC80DRAFT_522348 [Byssothecium circinans]